MKGHALSVEEIIRLEAYLLSERSGHPHGLEKTFWVQAEAIVHGRTAAVAPSVLKTAAEAPAAKAAPKKKTAVKAVRSADRPTATLKADQLLLTTEASSTSKPIKRPAKRHKVEE